MVHQVAAHHSRAVCHSVGVFITGREQQELGTFDAVGGNDECFARNAVGSLVRIVVMRGDDSVLGIMFELIDHGIGNQLGASRFGGVHGQPSVVLRIHRADRLTVVAAAAGGTAVEGAAVACN